MLQVLQRIFFKLVQTIFKHLKFDFLLELNIYQPNVVVHNLIHKKWYPDLPPVVGNRHRFLTCRGWLTLQDAFLPISFRQDFSIFKNNIEFKILEFMFEGFSPRLSPNSFQIKPFVSVLFDSGRFWSWINFFSKKTITKLYPNFLNIKHSANHTKYLI